MFLIIFTHNHFIILSFFDTCFRSSYGGSNNSRHLNWLSLCVENEGLSASLRHIKHI